MLALSVHTSLKLASLLVPLWATGCAPGAEQEGTAQHLAALPAVGEAAGVVAVAHSPVDSVMFVLADLTGNGMMDTVRLQVRSEDLSQPFHWSLEVRADGDVLFRHEADDSAFDRFFGHPGFAGNSGDRETDKLHYYFSRLPERVVQPLQWDEERSPLRSRDYPGGPFEVLPGELRALGITDEARISAIVDAVVARLKKGVQILSVPASPVLDEYPRIFVPEIGRFVTFYHW